MKKIYQSIASSSPIKESVHLEEWPEVNKKLLDKDVIRDMELARKIVEMGLALRAEKSIKVRQPLSGLFISEKLPKEYFNIIADELNVKEVKEEFRKMD